MNPHIALAPCRVEHYPALTAYQLTGEQAEFSRPPSDWLSGNIAFSAAQLAVTILRGDEPIGFYPNWESIAAQALYLALIPAIGRLFRHKR